MDAVDELSVFISEFRTRGPNGADDEFIEIYNATGTTINTTNWKIKKSSGCGLTSTDIVTGINISLAPGQYYLFARSGNYSGATPADDTFPASSTYALADDSGITLTNDVDAIIDQVGLCSTTLYKEGANLSAMSGTANQSYERKSGGSAGSCVDTDNNSSDFSLVTPSNPQNSASAAVPCLAVIDVTSSSSGIYLDTSGSVIDIQLEFSNVVTVTGSPTLLMEVGSTDRNAIYAGGSGTTTLTFNYTIQPGDNTSDLDYAAYNALSLNGGSIFGATGDAVLVLPKPNITGSGSLGDNEDIRIDNGSTTPTFVSFTRQTPTTEYTNVDELVFRATFSEAVLNVDINDFDIVSSTSATITQLTRVENGRMYDIKVSGGDLAGFDGDVNLDLIPAHSVTNVGGTLLPSNIPPTDQTYKVDNTPPSITSISQTVAQLDPTTTLPINFDLVFSEAIDPNTFTVADVRQNGTATGITWTIINSGNNQNFILSATSSGAGTLIPSIDAVRLKDLAGNDNTVYTAGPSCILVPNNCVTFTDTTPPTVTINQAAGQADPTSALPINFTVQFSEPINTATFTTADITQNGTASSVVWSLVNSGDNMTFTLSAASSGYGTLIPFIAANRVIDLSGNNNTASTSTDNSVTFAASSVRSIIINEVAWAGTTSSLTGDEWIELYNSTNASINITGWTLRAADGTPTITLNGTIPAGGYFLLERDDDNTVSDILADQIYIGELSNSGEALTLRDAANKVIDTANGNGGGWPKGSSSTYGTMERVSTSTENDSSWNTNNGVKRNGKNANGGDVLGTPKSSNSPLPTPTPTRTPVPTSTPRLAVTQIDPRPIINEILARPGFDWNQDGKADVFDEFIEIKNLTVVDMSLNGWRLNILNGASFSLPNVTLKPGERIVYYAKDTNLLLSDGGATVRLVNSSGRIYDAFTYELARAEDRSFCRLPDGNPGNSWFEDCIPTPNLTNSREGNVPNSPDDAQSPVCNLPDTIPLDFFIPECKGYGANIWNPYYWDQLSGIFKKWITDETSKWDSFIE